MASVWYYDPENGNGGNGGTGPSDAKATLKEAVTLANADGGADQTIYAMSSSARTPSTETSQVSVTCEGLTVIGYDSAGTLATEAGYLWDERPLLVFDHFGQGVVMIHASTLTFYGSEWDGNSKCSNGFSQGAAGARLECYDFIAHSFVGAAASMGSGGVLIQRFTLYDSANGVSTIAAGGTLAMANGTIRDTTAEAIDKTGTEGGIVFSVLVTGCGGTNGPLTDAHTVLGSATWSIQNCILVDNLTPYALVAGEWAGEANNCYSSDPGTYHTTNSWNGAKDATDYELDPLHTDPAGDDYHLGAASPMFGLAVTQPFPVAEDRAALPNVLGPLSADGTVAVAIVPRGTHSFKIVMESGYLLSTNAEPDGWALAGVTRVPWVATVTLGDVVDLGGVTAYQSAIVTTDRQIHEAATYTLSLTGTLYADESWVTPATFSGLRPSLTGGAAGSPAPLLLDLAAPWVRGDGVPGGFWERGSDGDYVMTGGIETVRKVVWAWLLTKLGEAVHSPGFGTELRHKRLRPADLEAQSERLADGLARRIPWVDSASVTLEFTRDNHMRVGIRVRAFGEVLNDTQAVQL